MNRTAIHNKTIGRLQLPVAWQAPHQGCSQSGRQHPDRATPLPAVECRSPCTAAAGSPCSSYSLLELLRWSRVLGTCSNLELSVRSCRWGVAATWAATVGWGLAVPGQGHWTGRRGRLVWRNTVAGAVVAAEWRRGRSLPQARGWGCRGRRHQLPIVGRPSTNTIII